MLNNHFISPRKHSMKRARIILDKAIDVSVSSVRAINAFFNGTTLGNFNFVETFKT